MDLLKTLFVVGASAGVGAWVGEKAFGLVDDKLPASVTSSKAAMEGTKLGMQAASAVVVYSILKSVF